MTSAESGFVSAKPSFEASASRESSPNQPYTRAKVRLRFRKDGPLRFIGHNDLMRCFDRLLRRSGLPIRISEGFHPKPRISSPLSLALGMVGAEEILEVELASPIPLAEVKSKLEKEMVPGLSLVSLSEHSAKERTVVESVEYRCQLPVDADRLAIQTRMTSVLSANSLIVERRIYNKPIRKVDIRPLIIGLAIDEPDLVFQVSVQGSANVRPEEILGALGLESLLKTGVVITRSRVTLSPCETVGRAANSIKGTQHEANAH